MELFGTKDIFKDILHNLSENNQYRRNSETLKSGTSELIYDVYFSDMLKNSKKLFTKLKELDEFAYMTDETIKNKVLNGWSTGKYKFEPESNTGEIFTYFGKMKFDSRGSPQEIEISLA